MPLGVCVCVGWMKIINLVNFVPIYQCSFFSLGTNSNESKVCPLSRVASL